jgi:hypothetical protein
VTSVVWWLVLSLFFFGFVPKMLLLLLATTTSFMSARAFSALQPQTIDTHTHTMVPPTARARTRARANWAVDCATGLPEVWALVAAHLGLVGAWRLMRVCRAARVGAKEFLSTLPGLVVCGGYSGGVTRDDVWRLDLATLRWGRMPGLVTARSRPACCAVRGKLVVLGGQTAGGSFTSSVEMLSSEEGAFVDLPPLSCGGILSAAAIAVDESDSAAGQVLMLGGVMQGYTPVSTVHLVDLATGVCTPGRPDMLRSRYLLAAAGLPGGRIVCAGGWGGAGGHLSSAEMGGAPLQGALDAAWAWRQLPAMSVACFGCRGCVMSDGRFAVLGGTSVGGATMSSCVALAIGDDDAHWEPLLPMHDARYGFACAAVAGCVIVAGGWNLASAEVYDEVRGRWLRLPFNLPHDLSFMGSALL